MPDTTSSNQRWHGRRQSALAVVLAALLVVSLMALAVPTLADSDNSTAHIDTIDEDTDLTLNETIDEFDETGYAVADVSGLDMSVHVAEDQRDVGVSGWTSGPHTYLRITYNESIQRTVRFYVPNEYVTPRLEEGVSAETGDETATFEPVDDGEYMAVTIAFDGETDAVFAVNAWMGYYIRASDQAYDAIEEVTNVSVPRLGVGGGEQWQYVPREGLAGENDTFAMPAESMDVALDMSLQYDSSDNASDANWRSVERCSVDINPVCLTDRDGDPVLFASTSDPPPVRYKTETSLRADIEAGWNELRDEWWSLFDTITGGL